MDVLDSSRPLLEDGTARTKDSMGEKLRKFSLLCQPLTFLALLALCIVALVYPFDWNSGKQSVLSSAGIANPFISKGGPPVENKKLVSSPKESPPKVSLTQEALDDMVSGLPGISMDSIADLTHYSGYVDALEGRQIHYWFFEAETDPENAPLFFWTNGGPGCSGLTGLLTEHGPFWAVEDGELRVNEFSWHTEVNIAYFEQPFGVGFSSVGEGQSPTSGDESAVADFDAAIRSFITKFPTLADNDVFLSSESFGGHYMPLTALSILKNNDAADVEQRVNLKGFLVGNPYTNGYENTIGAVEAFYGHGLMRNDIYETWREYCFGDETAMDNTHCRYIYMIAYYEADNVDHYAVDYNACEDDVAWDWKGKHLLFKDKMVSQNIDRLLNKFKNDAEWNDFTASEIRPMFDQSSKEKGTALRLLTRGEALRMKAKLEGIHKMDADRRRRRLNIEWAYSAAPYYPCAGDLMTDYLNKADVQSALHVKDVSAWEMCNDEVFSGWPESDWDNAMQPYYAELAASYPELKILIFSGDDDSVCGVHGTQYWLDGMAAEYGWRVDAQNEWIPWQFDEQLAGYGTTYLTQNGEVALYFHTVRTAGHMVPQTQPDRGLGILRKFLYEME